MKNRMMESLVPDTAISHYRVLSKLGEGGMGEVYCARGTRLDREVAIKILPASFANDGDRLRRFKQEALATSALNHPNILTIHDIGDYEGAPFIVYEMLSGKRAFNGDSVAGVMSAILKEEPPELGETNAKISPALEKIVRRC